MTHRTDTAQLRANPARRPLAATAALAALTLLLAAAAACGDPPASPATAEPEASPEPTPEAQPEGAPEAEPEPEPEEPPACPEVEGPQPEARSEMMGVFDTSRQQLVFFGGDDGESVQCSASPHPIGGLWVYDNRCAAFTEHPVIDGPGDRARGVAVLDTARDRMLVFGGRFRVGRSGPYTLYNEVWALNLASMSWELLQTSGEAPSPRVNTVAAYNPDKDEMVVFGGNTSNNGANFIPQNDVWILDLATNAWRQLNTSNVKPSKRLFHASALDAENNLLYVYGGGDEQAFVGPFFGDLWQLNVTTGVWTELHPGGNGAPLHRIFSSLAFDKASGDVILFAGHDDAAVGNQNDTWRFDVQARQWIEIIPPEAVNTPANAFCDFPPDFTLPSLDAPDRRSAHLSALDDVRGELLVFGGKTDCGLIDDVWAFDLQRDSWLQLKPSTQGEACLRGDNPERCIALCGP